MPHLNKSQLCRLNRCNVCIFKNLNIYQKIFPKMLLKWSKVLNTFGWLVSLMYNLAAQSIGCWMGSHQTLVIRLSVHHLIIWVTHASQLHLTPLRHLIGSHLFCSCHMYSISLEEDWPFKCATVGVKEFLFWSWAHIFFWFTWTQTPGHELMAKCLWASQHPV